uniref:Uncharacterized protein n=1 Tax=Arundo donax TaxID=35708 RepID=A0A0A9FLT5_ARUDO
MQALDRVKYLDCDDPFRFSESDHIRACL